MKQKLIVRSLAAAGLVTALSLGGFTHYGPTAAHAVTPQVQNVATAAPSAALPDFSQLVERYGPAVVNISVTANVKTSASGADLGMNPQNDGKMIRLPIPPLTEERRKEMVKKLHAAAEHHRVSIRNIRRDGNEAVKKLLKDKKITEDEDKRAHDEIQKITDAHMQKVDAASKAKEKEILEIR